MERSDNPREPERGTGADDPGTHPAPARPEPFAADRPAGPARYSTDQADAGTPAAATDRPRGADLRPGRPTDTGTDADPDSDTDVAGNGEQYPAIGDGSDDGGGTEAGRHLPGRPVGGASRVPGTPRRDPARRWRRPRDYALLALLLVAVLGVSTTVWYFSDARATVSRTAPAQAGVDGLTGLPSPISVPKTLHEAWSAPSNATPVPLVVKDSVVTGNDSTVRGVDPETGATRWSYTRNIPLCTVSTSWGDAVAVYRKSRNCSEVTALDGATGERGPQRNDNAELGTRLITDGTHMAATGRTLVDVWRYDLVQTTEYGTIPDPVNPGSQPRTGCRLGSFAISNGHLGVLERCPGEQSDRLTLLKTAPSDADKPETVFSMLIGPAPHQLVTISGDLTGVLAADPPRIVTFDGHGGQHGEYPVDIPDGDLRNPPADGVSGTTTGSKAVYWYTGSKMIALSTADLRPLWSVPDAMGPGTLMSGELLVPVPGGIAVLDQESGVQRGVIPVDRHGYQGVIKMSVAGDVVLEQRGETVVALR